MTPDQLLQQIEEEQGAHLDYCINRAHGVSERALNIYSWLMRLTYNYEELYDKTTLQVYRSLWDSQDRSTTDVHIDDLYTEHPLAALTEMFNHYPNSEDPNIRVTSIFKLPSATPSGFETKVLVTHESCDNKLLKVQGVTRGDVKTTYIYVQPLEVNTATISLVDKMLLTVAPHTEESVWYLSRGQ